MYRHTAPVCIKTNSTMCMHNAHARCTRARFSTIRNPKGARTPNKTALLRQIALISSSITPRNPAPSKYADRRFRTPRRAAPWFCYAAAAHAPVCAHTQLAYTGKYTRAEWHVGRIGESRVSEFNESEAGRKKEREESEAGVSAEYSRLILPSPKERMRRTGEG